jgi:hypothetical protein
LVLIDCYLVWGKTTCAILRAIKSGFKFLICFFRQGYTWNTDKKSKVQNSLFIFKKKFYVFVHFLFVKHLLRYNILSRSNLFLSKKRILFLSDQMNSCMSLIKYPEFGGKGKFGSGSLEYLQKLRSCTWEIVNNFF